MPANGPRCSSDRASWRSTATSPSSRSSGFTTRARSTRTTVVPHDAARVAARLSLAFWQLGRTEEAIELGEPAFELLARDEPDADVAMLAAELGRLHNFRGDEKLALARLDFALRYAEDHELPEVLSQALNTKSLVLAERRHESRALLNEALAIALEHDLTAAALRAFNNLVVVSIITDRPDEALRLAREGLELARSRGSRVFAASLGAMTCSSMIFAEGDWDGAFALAHEVLPRGVAMVPSIQASHGSLAYAAFARGDRELALEHLSRMGAPSDSGDLQQRSHALIREILLALVEERPADALGPAREQVDLTLELRIPILSSFSLELACEAAVAAGLQHDLADIVAPLDVVPPARRTRRFETAVGRSRGWRRPRPATTPRRRRRSRPRWQPHAASATARFSVRCWSTTARGFRRAAVWPTPSRCSPRHVGCGRGCEPRAGSSGSTPRSRLRRLRADGLPRGLGPREAMDQLGAGRDVELAETRARWNSTVFGLRNNAAPASLFVLPAATWSATWSSCGVSSSPS